MIAWLSYTFAQSTWSFEETYARLIDQVSTPKPSFTTGSVLTTSGTSTISLLLDAGPNGSGSLMMTIDYATINSMTKKWATMEANITIHTMLNGSTEWLTIDNLNTTLAGQIRISKNMAYIRLNTFDIDMSKLPPEVQKFKYIKNALGKWIRTPLPKDVIKILKQSPTTINPQMIISILKQYPIVKNVGYNNWNYIVKLNSNNIAQLIHTLSQSEISLSESEIQDMDKTLNNTGISWILTDSNTPVLNLHVQGNMDEETFASGTIRLWSGELYLNASIMDNTQTGNFMFSMRTISPTHYDYMMWLNMISKDSRFPYEFGMNMKWYEHIWNLTDYVFVRPIKSMTVRQFERYIEKTMDQ